MDVHAWPLELVRSGERRRRNKWRQRQFFLLFAGRHVSYEMNACTEEGEEVRKKIFIMSRSFSEDEDLERSDFAVLLCRHVNTRSVDCPSQSFNAIGVFGCFHFSAMTCLFCFNRFAIFFWPTFTLKGCCEPNTEFGLSVRRVRAKF